MMEMLGFRMHSSESNNKYGSLMRGALAVFPLELAVVPWGILAGSYAIEVGLTWLEAQAMSAVVFAGAAQLAAFGYAGIWHWRCGYFAYDSFDHISAHTL